jgi:magnesium transporter
MIHYFFLDATGLHSRGVDAPASATTPLWFDLLNPTADEIGGVERQLGISIPTRDEMREIESSNRLYEDEGSLYMTATVVTKLDTERPENTQVTYILAGDALVTVRYADPLPFRRFIAYAEKHPHACSNAAAVLAGLLEFKVNRIADLIESTSDDIDHLSQHIFTPLSGGTRRRDIDYRQILERVGRIGDLNSKARETLGSLGRLLVFLLQASQPHIGSDVRSRLKTSTRDIEQMSGHASFLGDKVQFMLDATLGMINIDQNNILKIFSVATVVLLPPSVIGAVFGMNFSHIPAAQHAFGFWAAIGAMVISAVGPYLFFKRRGWL